MSKTSDSVWLCHFSVHSWNSSDLWDEYLRNMETVLEDKIVRLDSKDPIRRRADISRGEGSFVTQFGARESNRWIAAKLGKTAIEFDIDFYKYGLDDFERRRVNYLRISVPGRLTFGPFVQNLISLFEASNRLLGCFYSYADFQPIISAKKPSGTYTINIASELLGICWLTYFGPHYCARFGRERLLSLQSASEGPGDGITLKLGSSPGTITIEERVELEQFIGQESFATFEGSTTVKKPGQYALTLEQLSEPYKELK